MHLSSGLKVAPWLFPLVSSLFILPVQAQISPASDNIGTIVLPNGNHFTIEGGTVSNDGANLFHSFGQFNLNSQETATFLTTPEIHNVLGRVIGGDPSLINGLLQLSGSDANLFLMNPAGILFGTDARLDVPGAFTATTATGIGFDNGWFTTSEDGDFSPLVGQPNLFAFGTPHPGSVVNLGHLAVEEGEHIRLLGGVILNTGVLSAPGGDITVAAVEGQNLVRISQDGMMLNLELETLASNHDPGLTEATTTSIVPASLASLLTGGAITTATHVIVDNDGTVRLTESADGGEGAIAPTPGTTLLSGVLDATATTGGNITVVGDRVALTHAQVNASGPLAGGTVRIGGDIGGQASLPTATTTWVDALSTIQADAQYQGDGGEVIIWADGTTAFEGMISAQGGQSHGNGGFVEVSGADTLIFRGDVTTQAVNGAWGTLLLDPDNIIIADGSGATNDGELAADAQILSGDGGTATFTISEQALETLGGHTNVTLQATNNITIHDLTDNILQFATGSGHIQFIAGGAFSMVDPTDTISAPGRSINIHVGSIAAGNIDTRTTIANNGGPVHLTAHSGDLTVGDIDAGTIVFAHDGGAITLTASGGAIATGALTASSRSATNANFGGAVTLSAGHGITTGAIDTRSQGDGTVDDGGAITLTTATGNISTGDLISLSSSKLIKRSDAGGNIVLTTSDGDITTGTIDSSSESVASNAGLGGNITIIASNGSINTGDLTSRSQSENTVAGNSGNGGAIALSATHNITTGNIETKSQAVNPSQAGSLTLQTGNGISIGSIDTLQQGAGGTNGNILLTANAIDFIGGNQSVQGGILQIRPIATDQDINIGIATNAGATSLDLSLLDIDALSPNLDQIILGRADGTGTITIFDAVTDSGITPLSTPLELAGGSTLIGPDEAIAWNITATNQGELTSGFANGLTFSSIENLTGGSGNDTFTFANGATITGTVQGNSGTDTLDYSAYTSNLTMNLSTLADFEQVFAGSGFNTLLGENSDNDWQITGTNSGTISNSSKTWTFGNFQNLVGGSLTDTFTVAPTGSFMTVNGGAGTNTLTGPDAAVNWFLIGTDAGSIMRTDLGETGSFANIQNIVGGTNNDIFTMSEGASLTGTLNSGLGTDTINYSAYISSPITYEIGGAATGAAEITNVETIIGSSSTAHDRIIGSSGDDVFKVTGLNEITVGATDFQGFEQVEGADGNDTFLFTSNTSGIAGTLDGGTGTNSLDYSGYTSDITVDLSTNIAINLPSGFSNINAIAGGSGSNDTIIGTTGNDTFTITATNSGNVTGIRVSAVETISGIDGDDTFIFDGGSINHVDGGLGNNSITGENRENQWAINSADSGILNSTNTFSGITALTGGTGNDTFEFANGITLAGPIDGNGGTDTLDYSNYTADPGVDLANLGATNIESIVGTTLTTSTLRGTNTVNDWSISGANSGTLNGTTAFQDFNTLIGGSDTDTFQLNGGSISGSIDGGLGSDTIQGSTGNDSVVITGTNAATINGSNVTAIEHFEGRTGSDSVQGTAGDDTLIINDANTATISGISITNLTTFDGGTGTDTVQATPADNTFTATGLNSGTMDGRTFTNIEAVDGQGGHDTVVGTGGADTINITATNTVSLVSINFDHIEALDGASGDDTFIVNDGVHFGGTLTGGSGRDRLDYSAYTTDITLDLGTKTATGFANVNTLESVTGGSSTNDRLTATSSNDIITLTTINGGDVNGFGFDRFEHLEGQTGDDTVVFQDGAGMTGTLDGGGGSDRLDYSDYTTPIHLNLADQTATAIRGWSNQEVIIGGTALDTIQGSNTNDTVEITAHNSGQWQMSNGTRLDFSHIESLAGGQGDDSFTLRGGTVAFINGNIGSNALIADNLENTWTITDANTGTLNTLAFENIPNITGGSQADTLRFNHRNAAVSGAINGGDGPLTLTGDTMTLGPALSGNGSLTIEPLSANRNIQLGSTDSVNSHHLVLSSAELNGIQDGFSQITIGRSDSQGQITLNSDLHITDPLLIQTPEGGGSIDTQGFSIIGDDNASLHLQAAHSIHTGELRTQGQTVTINSQTIETGNINTRALNGNGGNIALISGTSVMTGDLTTSGQHDGGHITIDAGQEPTTTSTRRNRTSQQSRNHRNNNSEIAMITGAIATQGQTGNGGNVTLAGAEMIQIESINAEGNIQGGTINITTEGLFRATDSFMAANRHHVSISSIGVSSNGPIMIRHGGNGLIPFEIGNSDTNGTAAAITNQANAFVTSEVFFNSITRGNAQILTQDLNSTPTPTPAHSAPPVTTPTPSTYPPISTPTITSPVTTPTPSTYPPIPNAPSPLPISLDPSRPETPLPDNVDFNQDVTQKPLIALSTSHTDVEDIAPTIDQAYPLEVEIAFTQQFQEHLTIPDNETIEAATIAQTTSILQEVERTTGLKPALLYAFFVPAPSSGDATATSNPSPNISLIQYDEETRNRRHDTLELILVTGNGTPIRHHLWDVTRADMEALVTNFHNQVTRLHTGPRQYLPPAQDLYSHLIEPLKTDLQTLDINSLTFILDSGLRSIPMAALHDGDRFLVEDYSISIMPSFSLVDPRNTNLHDMEVLAMGASEFQTQNALPAVPQELSAITQEVWQGEAFLNEQFTTENLITQRSQESYGIVHLATHANFAAGDLENSYIQFWDQRLSLDEMANLNLYDPLVELLVLSACNTALGNEDAELGFAGLSVQAGATSALASLWAVSDDGTLAFMTEFYQQLQDHATKVESIREAQLDMIKGDLWVNDGQLVYSDGRTLPLPTEYQGAGSWSLAHPLYWSAFTLIGSPW